MSNFAARLVARAARPASGPALAVLTPRPVSRFEPLATIDTQAEAVTAQADAASAIEAITPATMPAWEDRERTRHDAEVSSLATPQATVRQPNNDDVSVAARASAPHVPALKLPSPHSPSQQEPPVPTRDEAPLGGRTSAKVAGLVIPPRPEGADAPLKSSIQDDPIGLRLPVRVPGQDARIDQGHPATRADWVAPPAPTVSIGKIEVQFLPQEPRVPSSRPQPPRTRGFEAYARARRGEPR